MTKNYTPEDVYHICKDGNENELILALKQADNSRDWYRVSGWSALHVAVTRDHNNIIDILLGNTNIDVDIKSTYGCFTALHLGAIFGSVNCVKKLLNEGCIIDDNIDVYKSIIAPKEKDCRPLIKAELEHRRKRANFDSFISHHIEYQPYINSIYTLCYPTGNIQVAKPPVGWKRAEAIRDKYYLDEIFFYLHMHIANVYCNKYLITELISISIDHQSKNSNKTSTLMEILTDRLKMYLK